METRKMTVDDLIVEALKGLKEIDFEGDVANSNSRLIFPKKRQEDKRRVSEQEARFLFVNQLEVKKEVHDFYYSVETPTVKKYSFSGKGSRSGSIDVCLYSKKNGKYEREHLIEFKAHNPEQKSYSKDLEKLFNEPTSINYFVQIVEGFGTGTKNNLTKKYKVAFENKKMCNNQVKMYLYNLQNGEGVFLTKDDYCTKLDGFLTL